MQNLELNSDCDEVTASGAFGYVLLYLDDKPSMRWRFDKTMKLKLVWEKAGHSSKIQEIKSAYSFQKHGQPCFLAKDINLEAQEKYAEVALSSFEDKSAVIQGSILTSTHSVAPHERPITLTDTQKVSTETTYTLSNHHDNDEDFDMISESESDTGSKSENVPESIPSKLLCKCCSKIESNSEEEQNAHCVCEKLVESKNELTEHLKMIHNSEHKNENANWMDSKTPALSTQVHGERSSDSYRYSFELKKETQNFTMDSSKAEKITLVEENQQKFNVNKKGSSSKNISKRTFSEAEKQLSCKSRPKDRQGAKTCELCKTQYFKMTEHFETPSKKLECPSCHCFFQSQAHLIVHQDLYHNVGNIEAEETSDSSKTNFSRFSRANITDTGKDVSWSKKFHPCPICGIKLQNCHLVNHIKNMHTKESVFICCTCKKTLSNITMLKEHIDAHLGIETKKGKWHCSLCPAIFTCQSDFHRHSYTHRTFCIFCNKDFGFIKLLKQHYQQEHWDQLLRCRVCGHRVATKRQLWNHERHHKYKKPLPCHICGKSYRYMKAHLALHEENGDKTKGDSNSALINNGGTVANSKKYLCSMCPWTFPTEGWLVRHMTTIHKQDMGLKCPQCPKQFGSRTQLTAHIKRHVHKSEKKFVCSVCGKVCTENETLKLHMRIHALEKYLRCSICDQGFNYKVTLKTHMKSKHGIDMI
ncbi:hypothetical protein RRG08_003437 [Elysia crispata]|uniref:C2H2-type domain-containing protein n=1 Tax=Elysia crispata TaxID=231223 RepID=A0AAE1AB41_9GAST|nr:hypothetical protein RRG08_003437 [Elysia crispata]